MQETWILSLGWEDPLEKGKATHSSILAWRISWTVQSMGLQRAGLDWTAFTFLHQGGQNMSLKMYPESWKSEIFAQLRLKIISGNS